MIAGFALGSVLLATEVRAFSLRDENSELFNYFNSLVNRERLAIDENSLPQIDPEALYWKESAKSLNIFFINEGAGFRNQLFFRVNSGSSQIVFDDIASPESIIPENLSKLANLQAKIDRLEAEKLALLQEKAQLNMDLDRDRISKIDDRLAGINEELSWRIPALALEKTLGNNGVGTLLLGNGRSFGAFERNSQFEFFIKANGARGGRHIFGTSIDKNSDGLQHVIAYEYYDAETHENYVLLGFEDLYGELRLTRGQNQNSDRDFNDVVFVVRGVTSNLTNAVEVYEITSTLALLSVAGLSTLKLRRRSDVR